MTMLLDSFEEFGIVVKVHVVHDKGGMLPFREHWEDAVLEELKEEVGVPGSIHNAMSSNPSMVNSNHQQKIVALISRTFLLPSLLSSVCLAYRPCHVQVEPHFIKKRIMSEYDLPGSLKCLAYSC